MSDRLYYNFSNFDGRHDLGYGKAQPVPSFGKGSGSERSMGYSETGIYPYVPEEEVEDDVEAESGDFNFFSPSEIDKFVAKVNLTRPRFDPSRRADRASFVQNQRLDLGEMATMPKAMSGMVPFSAKTLYSPKGFDGPPLGTGNAGQAFRTTGPFKRTGTQYGTSRAPLKTDYEDDDFILSLRDILELSPDDRSIIRQNIKVKKAIHGLD